MRRSSACRLGGGGWASVTKNLSSSDHSRRCSTPCHLAASARKKAASVELRRAAAMAASALASPYCAAVTWLGRGTGLVRVKARVKVRVGVGVSLAVRRGGHRGAASIEPGAVLLPVGVAALEEAACLLREVRALPVPVVGGELREELRRHALRRAAAQQERALPQRVRWPERVLLAPAGPQEPGMVESRLESLGVCNFVPAGCPCLGPSLGPERRGRSSSRVHSATHSQPTVPRGRRQGLRAAARPRRRFHRAGCARSARSHR
jgi:hypothetical protein